MAVVWRPSDKPVLVTWLLGVLLLGVLGGYYSVRLPPTPPTPVLPPPVIENISDRIDEAGMITEDVKVVSSDGLVTLIIPKGTKALDAEGRRLRSITIEPVETNQSVPFPEPVRANQVGVVVWTILPVGLAYDLQPEGATFDPPIKLVMGYNKMSVLSHQGYSEGYVDYDSESEFIRDSLTAVYYDTMALKREFVSGTLNTEANVMTFRLDRTLRSLCICSVVPFFQSNP